MASFMLFKINNNLFSGKDGDLDYLDLETIVQKMNEVPTAIDSNNNQVNSAGFYNVNLEMHDFPDFDFEIVSGLAYDDNNERLYKPFLKSVNPSIRMKMITAEVTGQGSLGNYQQAYLDSQGVLSTRNAQQSFYTHASIRLLENGLLLVFFKMTSSEKIKGQIISLFEEELELELAQLRVSSELLLKVRQHTDWQNIKIDQIDNEHDKTTSVHYAVDLSNQTDPAVIHDLYKDKGAMVQLTSAIPYTPIGDALQTGAFTINLYQVGHRFSLLDAQFNNDLTEMKFFALHFASLLSDIIKHTP